MEHVIIGVIVSLSIAAVLYLILFWGGPYCDL